jgi:hypothetical protein
MSRSYREPEYRRRLREEAQNEQHETGAKQRHRDYQKAIKRIIDAICAITKQRQRDKQDEPRQRRYDRLFQGGEILALVAAAIVGVVAIRVGTMDSKKQRGIMQGQLTEMQAASRKADDTIVALKTQAEIMRGQLNVSRDEFTATERPWISVDSIQPIGLYFIKNPTTRDPTNYYISALFHFSLTNSGRTPAIFTQPDLTIVMIPKTRVFNDVVDQVRAFCAAKRSAKFTANDDGTLAAPNNTVHPSSNTKIELDYINKMKTVDESGREFIEPVVGGCINYQFTFGEPQRHQTGFIYWLTGPRNGIYLDGVDVPGKDITLSEMAGAWAN